MDAPPPGAAGAYKGVPDYGFQPGTDYGFQPGTMAWSES